VENELLDLFVDSVTVTPWSSADQYGQASYGTGVVYTGKIGGKNTMVRNAAGQEVVSSKQVIFSTTLTVSTKDKVTLPTGSVPLNPPILAVQQFSDEDGAHHTTIFL